MNLSISDIKEIVYVVSSFENMNYSGYTISFLKRRFSKIFDMLNIRKIAQFYEMIGDADVRDKVIGELFVDDTEMFRDPSFWRYMRDNILNQLPAGSTIWLTDESSGEEVFSLSIILKEKQLTDKLKILCNNPSKMCCNNIKNGILKIANFEINSLNYKRLEDNDFFDNYFSPNNYVYKASQEIVNNIKCKQAHYTKTVEQEKISMIFTRNQALYYNLKYSEQYFNTLYKILNPGGFLAIGVKEILPQTIEDKMIAVSEQEKIYKKI